MVWTFVSEVVEWRGPTPYVFAEVPDDLFEIVRDEGRDLVYWGQVPVTASIGRTEFATALFQRGEMYLLPLKVAVRRAEKIEIGDTITLDMRIRRSRT